jgi:hypothetical protein
MSTNAAHSARVADHQPLLCGCTGANQFLNQLRQQDCEIRLGKMPFDNRSEVRRRLRPGDEAGQAHALDFEQPEFEEYFGGVADVFGGVGDKAVQTLAGRGDGGLNPSLSLSTLFPTPPPWEPAWILGVV